MRLFVKRRQFGKCSIAGRRYTSGELGPAMTQIVGVSTLPEAPIIPLWPLLP